MFELFKGLSFVKVHICSVRSLLEINLSEVFLKYVKASVFKDNTQEKIKYFSV